jgi:dipeptidyl aminopeptidase/acylaminoacyl peptidase
MFGTIYLAEGAGPRPTVLLLTGNPGAPLFGTLFQPRNVLELAEPMRQAGFNVLTMNFRGSWGSGGRYGLVARIEDVNAALTFARAQAATYNVDTARLTVIGWSLGGFDALLTAVENPNRRCTVAIAPGDNGARRVERIRRAAAEPPNIDNAIVGLGGVSGRDLQRELLANQPRFDVVSRMQPLKGRPLLIVQAAQDQNVPADDVNGYVAAARTAGVAPFDHVLIDANHAFNLEGNRAELASVVVSWITKNCR